jgi:ribonuclease HI
MSLAAPHFLLYAEAAHCADSAACDAGRWRFVLRLPSGETSLEAADEEQETSPERLELLAVIRGLEALSQPSRVTLLSGSRAIRRGLEQGLSNWRENDWQWERYGRLAPVKNCDLWQRLDRLLQYHAIECRPTRLEKADDFAPPSRCMGDTPVPPQPATPVRKRGGRVVRIDQAHTAEKSEIRSAKAETNSKFKFSNARKRTRITASNFVHSNLSRASSFVLRILRSTYGWLLKRSKAVRLPSPN